VKNLRASAVLALIFASAAGQMPLPAVAEMQNESDFNQNDVLVRDLAHDSPVFHALTRESLGGKWRIRLNAPEDKPAAKSLYDQSRSMREGIIAIDVEDMDDPSAALRLIDGMIEAYQVQQGLSPYVLGINPFQAVFGLEPALGAQAQTIKLAVLLEIDAVHPAKGLLQLAVKKDPAFAVAFDTYRENRKSGKLDKQSLQAAFKMMLRAENGLSHRRAGEAISGFTRLCLEDATAEEKKLIYSFNIQKLSIDKVGEIPLIDNLFVKDELAQAWPVLGPEPIPGPALVHAFADGMERWYLNNAATYGINGVVTPENARRLAARAVDQLINAADSIAFEFISIKAESEPEPILKL
jgi:hypothetical protein